MNRLEYLRKEKELSQSDVGNILGITSQAVGLYERGKRDIPTECLLKLSSYFNVSVDYILGKTNSKVTNNNTKFYMTPVYGKISAGQPNWAEEELEGYIPVDPNLMGIINPEECFFLKVNGESMNKLVANGSYALIHKQDIVEDGEIAVVLVNDFEATLKKFSKQGDFIVLEPMSNDSSFTTQIYDKTTHIKILGKYIGKFEMKK